MNRRAFVSSSMLLVPALACAQVSYPAVEAGVALEFPRDHGAHPAFRTEWWYITGWLRDDTGRDVGVQLTFFRTRPGIAESLASRFAPSQLLFAHAAIADTATGHLRHDQRAARAGFDLARASEATTDVAIGDWSLRLQGDTYIARVVAREFAFELSFAAGAPMLQGERGVSRKGPRPTQASYYYSRPQLRATGTLTRAGKELRVTGTAWLDHEWSSEYLAADARGWDWTGLNFDDGSALMAFVIRGKDGRDYWAGGATRDASGTQRLLSPGEVKFVPVRQWRSPRTSVTYPVAVRLQVGDASFDLEPLIDDQELDSRATVGTIYWEGAVRASTQGRVVGRGYLELVGYGGALKI